MRFLIPTPETLGDIRAFLAVDRRFELFGFSAPPSVQELSSRIFAKRELGIFVVADPVVPDRSITFGLLNTKRPLRAVLVSSPKVEPKKARDLLLAGVRRIFGTTRHTRLIWHARSGNDPLLGGLQEIGFTPMPKVPGGGPAVALQLEREKFAQRWPSG